MGFLGWDLMFRLPDPACRWMEQERSRPLAGSSPGQCAYLRGRDWERRYTTFFAGAGAIYWGAGATIVTATDR